MKPYRRFSTVQQMSASVGVFVVLILLLESGGLYDWAQRLELGPERRVAMPVANGLHRLLAPLRIERARQLALVKLARIGWSDDPEAVEAANAPAPAGPVVSAGTPAAMSANVPGATASNLARPATPSSAGAVNLPHLVPLLSEAPPNLSVLPAIPPIAASQTRVIALAGDSMMAVGLYSTLHRMAPGYKDVTFVNAFKSGTGLARPEVFNWQVEYPAMLKNAHPDFVIVAIGANDGQGFVEDGVTYQFGTSGWEEVYERRVQNYLEMLESTGATVVWLGLPPMKSGVYDARIAWINRIFYSVVKSSPHAIWFSTAGIIGDQDGHFRDFGDVDGRVAKLRQSDGIHISDDGASLIVEKLLPWIAAQEPAPTVAEETRK